MVYSSFIQARQWPALSALTLLGLFLLSLVSTVLAQDLVQDPNINNNIIGTELWKAVRQNNLPLQSQVDSGGAGAIYTDGMTWLKFRDTQLMPYIAYGLGGTLLAIILFWLIRRSVKYPGGESGNNLSRTTLYERIIHWTMAGNFILLAITGFAVMYGRPVLIPLIGVETYAQIAVVSKTLHNYFGLIFPVSILLMFFQFVRRNIYEKGDLTWLAKGGGFFSKSHPSAGFFNMGEKMLFWLVILFGLLVSASGLVMVFQLFELSRTEMMIANSAHGVIAAAYVAIVFGHIYLSTLGVKGTLSAMTKGTVDENWAKAHHDRWYAQLRSK